MPRRGQVRKRQNGKYLARIYIGIGADGKRHWLSKTFAKKKEADTWLSDQLSDKAHGTFQTPSKENMSQYLHRWLDDVAAQRVRERTLADYTVLVVNYLIPHIGNHKINELRADHIQKAYNTMTKDNGPSIARKAHAVLHSALNQAVKWRLTAQNAASLCEPPRITKKEIRPLSPEEVTIFLTAIKGDRYEAFFTLLLDTGMRPGEALALKWDDINFDTRIIQINKALSTGTKKLYLGETKTVKSRRNITITNSTIRALRAHKNNIEVERNNKLNIWQDNNLMFPNAFGNYSDEHNISARHFKPIIKKLTLPETTRIYDLRHTVATLLLAANTNPKLVAERLGHADITMTLNRYTHLLPTMQEQVANTMEAFLSAQKAH